MRPDHWARLALLVYMAWLLYAALGAPPQGPEIPHLDKLMHAGAWGLMAAIAVLAWPERLWLAFCLALGHGALTEILQGTVVSGRSAEWLDLLADGCGAALVVWIASRRRRSSSA
jgi:VanZ family protein